MHGDVLVQAVPLGGIRLIDRGQADDKIIAYLQQVLELSQYLKYLLSKRTNFIKAGTHYLIYQREWFGDWNITFWW